MKLINFFFLIFIISFSTGNGTDVEFGQWKNEFKKKALQNNISEKTIDITMANVKFLPQVIKYDRYQPEFYEDTKTYVSKRTSSKKVKKGLSFFNNNEILIKSKVH